MEPWRHRWSDIKIVYVDSKLQSATIDHSYNELGNNDVAIGPNCQDANGRDDGDSRRAFTAKTSFLMTEISNTRFGDRECPHLRPAT